MAEKVLLTRQVEQLEARAAVQPTDLIAVQVPGGPLQKAELSQLAELMGDELGVALANPSAGKRYATTAAAHADVALLTGMYFDVVPSENGGAYDVRLRTGGGSTLITTTANLATIGTEVAAFGAGTAQAAYLAKTGYLIGAATDVPRGITARAFVGGTGYTNGAYKIYSADSNFIIKPCVSVTVAGGIITAVTVINKGLYIGAAPTTPTISLATLGAGIGGSITLTVGFIEANHYWVQQADTGRLRLYFNNAGVATAFAPAQYRDYDSTVEMVQSAVPQPYVLVPKSGQIVVVGSDQIYTWTQSPAVGANSTAGAPGENVLITIAALMSSTVALLPTGKQVPFKHPGGFGRVCCARQDDSCGHFNL
jgi:hypothetical protein